MKRLIDACELSEMIKSLQVYVGFENCVNKHYKQSILQLIDEMPTEQIPDSASLKQIPQRPKLAGDVYFDGEFIYDEAYCPICKKKIAMNDELWGCNYCPDCGQALRWGK